MQFYLSKTVLPKQWTPTNASNAVATFVGCRDIPDQHHEEDSLVKIWTVGNHMEASADFWRQSWVGQKTRGATHDMEQKTTNPPRPGGELSTDDFKELGNARTLELSWETHGCQDGFLKNRL